jgi:hypothetical protein
MSVDISVSNNKNTGCKDIIEKLRLADINARTIETLSIVDGDIERGCIITLGKKYIEKENLHNFWNIINKDYICSHININGLFNGCIYNYILDDRCPGNNN